MKRQTPKSRHPYRRLYKTKRWQQLRMAVLVRDTFICQVCGELCTGTHRHDPDSPVVNHKLKAADRPDLFFDMDNLETVHKRCHDSHIQSIEKDGAGRPVTGPDGWPFNVL